MSVLSKRKMDKLDNEKRKKEKEYLPKKEYELMKAEDYVVVKDNRLIQKATFDFSELEMKCINYTISKMKPDKVYTEQDYFELSVSELCKLMNIKNEGANYKNIRQAFSNIGDKSKRLKFRDNDMDLDFRFFLKVYGSEKGGWIKVSFMQELLDYLQGIKRKFTEYELYYSLILQNKYAIRMYELCKSYQNMGHFTFYIDKCRVKWCVPTTYNYGTFKKFVIDKSIEEINNKTDIKIEIIDTIKMGRKTTAYEIKIIDNSVRRCMEIDKKNKSTQ